MAQYALEHGESVDTETAVFRQSGENIGQRAADGSGHSTTLYKQTTQGPYWLEVPIEYSAECIAFFIEPIEATRWLEQDGHVLPEDLAALLS